MNYKIYLTDNLQEKASFILFIIMNVFIKTEFKILDSKTNQLEICWLSTWQNIVTW